MANVTPIQKREEPTDKENYRPTSELPLQSEKLNKLAKPWKST